MDHQPEFTRNLAVNLLTEALNEIPELRKESINSQEFSKWNGDTHYLISRIFGSGTHRSKEFARISYLPYSMSPGHGNTHGFQKSFQSGLDRAEFLLKSMIHDIKRFWSGDELESNRTKNPTSMEALNTMTHSVFQETQFTPNEHLVFMLSPFREPFNTIYSNHIRPTVEGINNLTCVRADDIYDNRPVIDDIWRLTNEARIIIAELTDRNPNVFYETGLAHAIDKEVILITQSGDDVPFDLRHRRYIRYQDTHEGIEKLKVDLTNTITNILNRTNENSVAERTSQLLPERLAEETPHLPPHGITGDICRKAGLYRVQGGGPYLIQKTFEEGAVFPSAATRFGEVGGFPLGMNEEIVTWVYQPPGSDEHEN